MREIRQSGSVRGVRRNLYPYRDQDGLVEEPLGFRPLGFCSVLCAPLCMLNGPQHAIQAVAPLAQRRMLPRKRDRQRLCSTVIWAV